MTKMIPIKKVLSRHGGAWRGSHGYASAKRRCAWHLLRAFRRALADSSAQKMTNPTDWSSQELL
uniref:Uncharacterized protein n=1 Tax=Arundo donax TaxID=35708 RepID=A0A0A9BWE7_ARUDO